MGIAFDPLNTLLIVSAVVIIVALALDELQGYMTTVLKRYRPVFALGRYVTWQTLLPLLISVILAAVMREVLISPYLVAVGAVITFYLLWRAQKRQQLLSSRQILQLIIAFRSGYQLQPSIFSTLDGLKERVEEPLRSLVRVIVQTYYATSSPERAFAELRARTDNVYLSQFAYILEMSETARADAVVKALDNLVERLGSHDELRRDTEASLLSITGQTSVILGLSVLIILVVAAVPDLRVTYTSTRGQLYFVVSLTVMLLATYYIDRMINKLKERIS